MGAVLKFHDKHALAIKGAFCALVKPCQVYRVDHYHTQRQGLASRIVIEQYEHLCLVKHWNVSLGGLDRAVRKQIELPFPDRQQANDKIEELVTCLELEGWMFIDDAEFSIYDVNKNMGEVALHKLEAASISDHQREQHKEEFCVIRPMVNGVHAIATMDPNGKVTISPVRGAGGRLELEDYSHFQVLGRIEGAKGFAAEGIWNGAIFLVTDVLYLHNRWIMHLDFETREQLFSEYLHKNKIVVNRVKMQRVRVSALTAMIGTVTKGLIVYWKNSKKRIALAMSAPRTVSFSQKVNYRFDVFDHSLNGLGKFPGFGNIDLSYREYICLNHEPGRLGLELLIL